MPPKKLPPPPIPAPTAKEIERAKTDRHARKRVNYQLQRVKQREEEIARWKAENADAGAHNLGDAFVPPPPHHLLFLVFFFYNIQKTDGARCAHRRPGASAVRGRARGRLRLVAVDRRPPRRSRA